MRKYECESNIFSDQNYDLLIGCRIEAISKWNDKQKFESSIRKHPVHYVQSLTSSPKLLCYDEQSVLCRCLRASTICNDSKGRQLSSAFCISIWVDCTALFKIDLGKRPSLFFGIHLFNFLPFFLSFPFHFFFLIFGYVDFLPRRFFVIDWVICFDRYNSIDDTKVLN